MLRTGHLLRPASNPASRPRTGASLPGTLASPRTGPPPAGCPQLVAWLRHHNMDLLVVMAPKLLDALPEVPFRGRQLSRAPCCPDRLPRRIAPSDVRAAVVCLNVAGWYLWPASSSGDRPVTARSRRRGRVQSRCRDSRKMAAVAAMASRRGPHRSAPPPTMQHRGRAADPTLTRATAGRVRHRSYRVR